MCGIAGLFLTDPALEPQLGGMLAGMMAVLSDRGPDSAGFAVYGDGRAGTTKLTLAAPPGSAPLGSDARETGWGRARRLAGTLARRRAGAGGTWRPRGAVAAVCR
ncbi:MAG: hypothetical protein WDN25_14165 [Acetobacteraceae bacterium]